MSTRHTPAYYSHIPSRKPPHPSNSSPAPPKANQIYVLSADGSSLWLVDPTKPPGNEEPPPYASVHRSPTHHESVLGIHGFHGQEASTSSRIPGQFRARASTLSSLGSRSTSVPSSSRGHASLSRYNSSYSHVPITPTRPERYRSRSYQSSPNTPSQSGMADETTPLLFHWSRWTTDQQGHQVGTLKRGRWRSIFCGELESAEEVGSWKDGWRRFWRPVGQGKYWRAMGHLVLLNFPFALLIWPPLLVGTLAGTALLITLPIGAMVWWLTLIIARSAARLETLMQLHHHAPLNSSSSTMTQTYHPIFYRIKEGTVPSSPVFSNEELPADIIWEKGFIKCSWAMFSDHYSYSALSYFLLIKPIITLFSTIILLAFLPVSMALIFGFPIYLRAIRRWGKWQAGVALENL